jgi:hypothetical protein
MIPVNFNPGECKLVIDALAERACRLRARQIGEHPSDTAMSLIAIAGIIEGIERALREKAKALI